MPDYIGADAIRVERIIRELTADRDRLRAALENCVGFIQLGDERGNPNEREIEAEKEARAALAASYR